MFSQWLSDQDELFKFISAPGCDQQQTMQKNTSLVNVNPPYDKLDVSVTNTKPKQSRRRKLKDLDNTEESPTDYIKKIIHRDVERQRRQEMAGLYEKLRLLIPSEHLEGKRSISDHIHATVKYINHQETKLDDLKNKRDKLKEWLINPTSSKVAENRRSDVFEQHTITVKTCRAGMEITATSGMNEDLPLSRIINFLILEGMSIKNCISTRIQERLLHIIESEVNEERSIDPNELQKKLMEIVCCQ